MAYNLDSEQGPIDTDLKVGLMNAYSNYVLIPGGNSQVNSYIDTVRDSLDSDLDILVGPEYIFAQGAPLTVEERDTLYKTLAESTEGHNTLVMPGSCFWQENGVIRNTMPIFHNGKLIGHYDKMSDALESCVAENNGLKYQRGQEPGLFSFKGLDIGVEICADYGTLYKSGVSDLDLYILSSCGISLLPYNNATHENGYRMASNGCTPEVQMRRKSDDGENEIDINPDKEIVFGEKLSLNVYTLDMSYKLK